jgi:hypothetical protein
LRGCPLSLRIVQYRGKRAIAARAARLHVRSLDPERTALLTTGWQEAGRRLHRIFRRARPMSDLRDGRHDFDFLHGLWRVRNERLRTRLTGSEDWDVFEAGNDCRPLLGGLGNVDEFSTAWRGGYRGLTLRLYDPRARRWSIRWANDEDGVLEPPVYGSFEHGVGTFYGDDTHDGRPVRVRFIWDGISPVTACWQQAFSVDGGATWETNWFMRMTREGATP